MGCDYVQLPGGGAAIVCSRGSRGRSRVEKCQACSKLAAFQCDWILRRVPRISGGRQSRTDVVRCDAHLCAEHAREIAPNKHVCPVHSITFDNWKKERDANAADKVPAGS